MRRSRVDFYRRLFQFAGLLFLIPAALHAQTSAPEPRTFAQKYLRLSHGDLTVMERGEALARILDSTDPIEVPPFGVVRVLVSAEFFLDQYRDIAKFKRGKEVLQIAKLHRPPLPEDFASLTLEPEDIESLKKCKVGDCNLKLPAKMIDRFRTEINWSAPDHLRQANALYRQHLFDYVKSYLADGNAALATYNDKKEGVRLAEQFYSLLQASPYVADYLPALRDYLLKYPKGTLPETEDFIYWSKEKFGFKAVVSLTHVTIHKTAQGETKAIVIASKQIYANHYFVGSLGLSAFLESPPGAAYLMYLNRSRVDLLQGFFSGLKRFILKRRLLDGTEKYLRLIKDRLETDYRAKPAS